MISVQENSDINIDDITVFKRSTENIHEVKKDLVSLREISRNELVWNTVCDDVIDANKYFRMF